MTMIFEDVPAERRRLMARVRAKDSRPELTVRRGLHALGARFRLHRRDLPGTPDVVLPGRRVAVFVHGCFWHRHVGCRRATTPKTRAGYWQEKFDANVFRDAEAVRRLRTQGWTVETIWECETLGEERLKLALERVLAHSPKSTPSDRRGDLGWGISQEQTAVVPAGEVE